MISGISNAVLAIVGMKDNACRERIVAALGRVEGVTEVTVSLIRSRAIVMYGPPCNPLSLVHAVIDAGFGVLDETGQAILDTGEAPSQATRRPRMSLMNTELKARDVMTADPVCVAPSTRVRELARVFEDHEISGAPVVDQQGRVVGVVSKTDLIRRCSEGIDDIPPAYLFEVLAERGGEDDTSEVIPEPLVCVEDFMTDDPLMVGPDHSALDVARLMYTKRVHRVIVADEGRFPLGVITSMDLLGAISG